MIIKKIYYITTFVFIIASFFVLNEYKTINYFLEVEIGTVIPDVANIRKSPSTNSDIISTATQGDTLTIHSTGEWVKANLNDREGYIHSSLIKIETDLVLKSSTYEFLPYSGAIIILILGFLFRNKPEIIEENIKIRRARKANELYDTGLKHFDLSNYKKAVQYFERAIKKRPDYHKLYHYLAPSYDHLQLYDQSLSAYERLLEVYPVNSPFDHDKHKYCYDAAKAYYQQYVRTKSLYFKDKSLDKITEAIELNTSSTLYKNTRSDIERNRKCSEWESHKFYDEKVRPEKDKLSITQKMKQMFEEIDEEDNIKENKEKKRSDSNNSNQRKHSKSKDSNNLSDPPPIDWDNLNLFNGKMAEKKTDRTEEKSTQIDTENKYYKKPKPLHQIQAYQKLQKLIGMEDVARETKEIAASILLNMKRSTEGSKSASEHFVLYGSPGTGKTTVAKLLAEILKEIGYLKKGHFIEVSRADLIGEYIGKTAGKTKEKIKEAMGGVLFIDEAYSLNAGGFDYGKEAISTLLLEMENKGSEFVVITAGYKNEMKEFIGSNPGLESRFTNFIEFKDFKSEELLKIFHLFLHEEGFQISEDAELTLKYYIDDIHKAKGKDFGNAREIRKIFQSIRKSYAVRIMDEAKPDYTFDNWDVLNGIEKLLNNKM